MGIDFTAKRSTLFDTSIAIQIDGIHAPFLHVHKNKYF